MKVCVFRAKNHMGFMRMCVETIRYHNPTATIIHLAAMETPAAEGVDEVRRLPWDGTDPGAVRMRLDHMCDLGDEPTMVLDDDMLICGPLDDAFKVDQKYAAGVTRKHNGKSYNCGFMFSYGGPFWDEIRKRFDAMTLNWMNVEKAVQLEAESGSWNLNQFDFRIWNNYLVDEKGFPDDAKIVHFKGGRKGWMEGHFNRGSWKKEKVAA